ncbi:MAG: LacI family DNA-binding transcriptional regulator [Phycisphaerales bacterium]|nr:LacI family DNA-binding transcriptional regulator [Phycisphaerales bacterium]
MEIARRLGLSQSTVAHVLNQTPGMKFSEQTRGRIMSMADRLDYQAVRLRHSIKSPLRHIGIAVGEADERSRTYTNQIFNAASREALERRYYPVMHSLPTGVGKPDHSAAVARIVELYETRLSDGFILDKACFLSADTRQLAESGIPIVLVHGSPQRLDDGREVPAVTIDDFRGGRLGTEHLLELGHRRIAMICRPYWRLPSPFRVYAVGQLLLGYTAALHEAGLTVDPGLIADADPADKQTVYEAVNRLMALKQPPTAIFAGDDALAVMAIHALNRRGLGVPWDVSVMGYEDWAPAVQLSEPALTTVHVPLEENGRQAAAMLIQLLEKSPLAQMQLKLDPSLIVRESTQAVG